MEITNEELYKMNKDLVDKIDSRLEIIYAKLIAIEKHAVKTNGRVTLNRWIASTALATVTILIGLLTKL